MRGVYNIAINYLHNKYSNDTPDNRYTDTDLNIKNLLREYSQTPHRVIEEDLKTALDYVWLWKAATAYDNIKTTINNMLYKTFVEKYEDNIVEWNDSYVLFNHKNVIFKVINFNGCCCMVGEFECFDCLGNSFGVVKYMDIPERYEDYE